MIEVKKYSELLGSVKDKLNSYIELEFGHIPIVRETEWASPDWSVIYFENDSIATFYNIIETEIRIDKKMNKVGGINNVITPEAYRGKGFASKALERANRIIFDDLNCDLGLLLCAKILIPFYERLGWYQVDCPVYFEQSTGVRLWEASTMLLTRGEQLNPQKIELRGLPW